MSALELDVKTKSQEVYRRRFRRLAAAAEAKDALGEARLKLASAQEALEDAKTFWF